MMVKYMVNLKVRSSIRGSGVSFIFTLCDIWRMTSTGLSTICGYQTSTPSTLTLSDAARPARRPKTAPDVSPLPPG